MNKRGEERLLSMYWFLLLFLVAAGVVYIVLGFYGDPLDVRQVEAELLLSSAADCFSSGGYIAEGFEQFDLQTDCSFVFNASDLEVFKERQQYFLEVTVLDFETKNVLYTAQLGDAQWPELCLLESSKGPVCVTDHFYATKEDGSQYDIKLIAAVAKVEKNV